MAGLLLSQNIAGAADVHIMTGQRKTGAQRIQRLQNAQAPLGYRIKLAVRRNGEISIAPDFAAPYSSLELVKLCQTEHIGAVDDHGVDPRHINAGFDNRGG